MKQLILGFCGLVSVLSFGQITIGSGTNVDSNSGLCTPVSNFYSTSLAQFIYLASEINAQPGSITGLKFYLNSTSVLTNSDGMIDVWIGHTSRSSYSPVISSTGADWIPISTHTQVLTNGTFVQTGNLITVTLTTPFNYNGTDNLVLTVDANEPNSNEISILYYQTAASNSVVSLMYRTDNALQNPVPMFPPLKFTGTVDPTSTQAKYTRPIITLEGLMNLGTESFQKNNIVIFPNPVDDLLHINSTEKINSISIYDGIGKFIESRRLTSDSISTSSLMPGIYTLKINLENDSIIYRKLIKK